MWCFQNIYFVNFSYAVYYYKNYHKPVIEDTGFLNFTLHTKCSKPAHITFVFCLTMVYSQLHSLTAQIVFSFFPLMVKLSICGVKANNLWVRGLSSS